MIPNVPQKFRHSFNFGIVSVTDNMDSFLFHGLIEII